MEHRVTALETRLDTTLPTLATKADVERVRADIADIRTDINKSIIENNKWTHTALVGMYSLIVVGIGGLGVAIWNASKAPAPQIVVPLTGVAPSSITASGTLQPPPAAPVK